ncbi:Imm63 family immunity protein [Thalassospira alkalitolerans]|uniref:Imm63 family immunity protein n=1 Tax=Thalassospira alkalitolerans TaxID=1293890 RepID=UPI003AA83F9A
MNIPNEILTTYRRLSEKMNGQPSDFPLRTVPDNFGGKHLEFSEDGKMALVATDRGIETKRLETYSVDELMYWIFKNHANSKSFYQKNSQYDYVKCQKIALEEIGKVSNKWRERLRKEQEKYHDQPS